MLENSRTNDTLQFNINKLENELEETTSQLKITKDHLTLLNNCLQTEKDKIRELEMCKTELLQKVTSLEETNLELEQECQSCKTSLSTLQEDAILLREQAASHDSQLKEAHDKLYHDYHKLNDEYDALSAKFNSLTVSNTNIRAEYEEELKRHKDQMVVSFEAQLNSVKEELEMKNIKILDLEENFKLEKEDLNSQLTSMTNSVQEGEYKINELSDIIKEHETAKQIQSQTVADLNEKILSLQEEKENMKQINNLKDRHVEELMAELENSAEKIITLKTELERLISENENLIKQFTCAQNSLLESKKELTQKDSRIGELEAKLEENEKQYSLKTLENSRTNETLQLNNKKLENDLDEKTSQLKRTNEHLSLLNNCLQTEKDKICELELFKTDLLQKVKSLEETNLELEQECQSCKTSLSTLQEDANLLIEQAASYDPQLKEAHDKLYHDYHKLNDEYDALTAKFNSLTVANTNVRAEYDEKLKRLKDQMKETCTNAMRETEKKCDKKIQHYKESILSSEEQIRQLSSQLWNTSDKLVITKKQNEELKKTLVEFQNSLENQSLARQRSRSHQNLSTPPTQLDVEDTFTITRRRSLRTVPSGMGKVFPSEDEGEEMFNNACLADLKAGRCAVSTDPNRVSTLMYRNSLCPPHLKSSYPAETQFLPLDDLREDDIKGRGDDGDSKSLLSEKHRRKDRSQTQTLEHKAATPRNALRELNDTQKKPGTPSRLFSQMFSSRHKDENTPTAKDRKLSFFKGFGRKD